MQLGHSSLQQLLQATCGGGSGKQQAQCSVAPPAAKSMLPQQPAAAAGRGSRHQQAAKRSAVLASTLQKHQLSVQLGQSSLQPLLDKAAGISRRLGAAGYLQYT